MQRLLFANRLCMHYLANSSSANSSSTMSEHTLRLIRILGVTVQALGGQEVAAALREWSQISQDMQQQK